MLTIACGNSDNQDNIIVNATTSRKSGIFLSGGDSSTLLLYLLCLDLKNKNAIVSDHLTHIFVMEEFSTAQIFVLNILKWIKNQLQVDLPAVTNLTSKMISEQSTEFMVRMSAYLNHAIQNYDIERIYLPHNRPTYNDFNPERLRVPQAYTAMVPSEMPWLETPFNYINKHHILDLYSRFDIQELSKLTHSCNTFRFKNCNECYKCQENIWARKMLINEPN